MKFLFLLLAVSVAALASSCSSVPKQEPVVCVPEDPAKSEAAERDGLDRNYIACVIERDSIGKARACYESTFTDPGYTVEPIRTMTKFQIDVDGHVTKAETVASRGGDKLPKCVNEVMKSLSFAKPFGNVPVKVSYPFMFKRSNTGSTESIFDNF